MITSDLHEKISGHIRKAEAGLLVQGMAALMVDLETLCAIVSLLFHWFSKQFTGVFNARK